MMTPQRARLLRRRWSIAAVLVWVTSVPVWFLWRDAHVWVLGAGLWCLSRRAELDGFLWGHTAGRAEAGTDD